MKIIIPEGNYCLGCWFCVTEAKRCFLFDHSIKTDDVGTPLKCQYCLDKTTATIEYADEN